MAPIRATPREGWQVNAKRVELRVYFQPIVRTVACDPVGVEALVRWQDPNRGLVSPEEFIPLAEANGSIVPIGNFVLRAACARVSALQRRMNCRFRLTVNVSPRQLREPRLIEVVRGALHQSGLGADSLTLELTEGMVAEADPETLQALEELRVAGIHIAIDDFGTGYSSLADLRRFPVDYLKIDRSFIRGLETDHEDRLITETILAMSRSLGLSAIAEGVATEASNRGEKT